MSVGRVQYRPPKLLNWASVDKGVDLIPAEPLAFEQLRDTYHVLVGDCQHIGQLVLESDTPVHRRIYVHAVSAFLEGMADQMRFMVRRAIEFFHQEIDRIETSHYNGFWKHVEIMAKLDFESDEILWLFEKGQAKGKKRFRTAVACYAKLHLEKFDFKCQPELNKFKSIRDAIAHPRSAADLEISNVQWQDVLACVTAVRSDMERLFSICNAKVQLVESRSSSRLEQS